MRNALAVGGAESSGVSVSAKFFRVHGAKWHVKGLTYGPFAPNSDELFLPERPRLLADLRQMRELGANVIRLYHPPDTALLDDLAEHGLRVLIDVPWQKHRCFLEDWSAQEEARKRVGRIARELGGHPAIFAISVANEIPADIVRFHGRRRVERFLDELLDIVKQRRPECLATYTNYPSTEFMCPSRMDFHCFNVYLDDPETLGRYLDRLQHQAGHLPLILGEYGLDSLRHGEQAQAEAIAGHLQCVRDHGLAGSFIFSFTDDWYTGGHQVEDWAFGVTDRQRVEKPAAQVLRRLWACPSDEQPAPGHLPKVSVVICSYNGAATLEECLSSLERLNYPDYEVILVDDGSRDRTPEIAEQFPWVRYIRQFNQGLSVARNVGAEAATGEIVAYTDSDCVVDADWLLHLIGGMLRQGADAIGGPNVPPYSDIWIAKCVAASPGGPSHVMLDDRRAEHVPGCNMAFRREKLLEIGGFDPQFRQAGDDVDICWRWMDAGMEIGYAPAALVWHHRRSSIRAYLKQQAGYGRSEAMLHFKHPHRFNSLGNSLWRGVIYGEGAVGLPLAQPVIYHGRFGSGLFQTIYRQNRYSPWAYFTLLEWHVVALILLVLGLLWPPLAVGAGVMWVLTLAAAGRWAWAAPLGPEAPWWCRPMVFAMHLLQPVVRSSRRYLHRLGAKHLPLAGGDLPREDHLKPISPRVEDVYWESERGRGREALLEELVSEAASSGWRGVEGSAWMADDLAMSGDRWHKVRLRTASEELGSGRRFTRVRCFWRWTYATCCVIALAAVLTMIVMLVSPVIGGIVAAGLWGMIVTNLWQSRMDCRRSLFNLIWRAGHRARLNPVRVRPGVAAAAALEPEPSEVAAA